MLVYVLCIPVNYYKAVYFCLVVTYLDGYSFERGTNKKYLDKKIDLKRLGQKVSRQKELHSRNKKYFIFLF